MNKRSNKKLVFISSLLLVAANGIGFAKPISSTAKETKTTTAGATSTSYIPYLQIGGTKYFPGKESKAAANIDLFIPIWQQNLTDLVFTDLRISDRTGPSFEGNIHLGYRHLIPSKQQLWGVYGAFDRRKTGARNFFNQVTLGGEYWIKNWFLGANIYKPFGKTTKNIDAFKTDIAYINNSKGTYDNIEVTTTLQNEKALPGVDAEVGYEFIDGLVGYVGGYYFKAADADKVCGPKARLAYDWSAKSGRILGVFDKIGLEAAVKRDKPRGTAFYLSANFRIGLLPDGNSKLQGIYRHMVDPVRRDIDIVAGTAYQKKIHHETGRIVTNDKELEAAVKDPRVTYVDARYNVTTKSVATIKDALARRSNLNLAIDGQFDVETIGNTIGDPDGRHYHLHKTQQILANGKHPHGEISAEALKALKQDLKGKVSISLVDSSIMKENVINPTTIPSTPSAAGKRTSENSGANTPSSTLKPVGKDASVNSDTSTPNSVSKPGEEQPSLLGSTWNAVGNAAGTTWNTACNVGNAAWNAVGYVWNAVYDAASQHPDELDPKFKYTGSDMTLL